MEGNYIVNHDSIVHDPNNGLDGPKAENADQFEIRIRRSDSRLLHRFPAMVLRLRPGLAGESGFWVEMNELHLFAGAGGGILGGILLGHTCICAVEIEPYRREILLQRQRDGILPRFPIWDDVRTFDGKPWRGKVDVVCGGFPCQDISVAGNGIGISGPRSGLWTEMFRVVCEVGPKIVFVENSPMLTVRGLGRVLGDLATMGFNAKWGVLGACHVGAPHERERLWIFASNPDGLGSQAQPNKGAICQAARNGRLPRRLGEMGRSSIWSSSRPLGARPMGVGNGVAHELDRIAAVGDGQVPAVVALAWRTLMNADSV